MEVENLEFPPFDMSKKSGWAPNVGEGSDITKIVFLVNTIETHPLLDKPEGGRPQIVKQSNPIPTL